MINSSSCLSYHVKLLAMSDAVTWVATGTTLNFNFKTKALILTWKKSTVKLSKLNLAKLVSKLRLYCVYYITMKGLGVLFYTAS